MPPPNRRVARKSLAVGAVLSVIAFAACSKESPTTRQITGQVFIVTRSKESVKMGLVEVHLYDLSEIEKWVKDVSPRIATIQNRAQQLAEQADRVAAEANQYATRLIDDYRLEDHEFIAAAAERADEANLVQKAAQAFFLITQSGVPYYGELPKERLLSTKTDADGNFSF
jgi:hypothetical protein